MQDASVRTLGLVIQELGSLPPMSMMISETRPWWAPPASCRLASFLSFAAHAAAAAAGTAPSVPSCMIIQAGACSDRVAR